MTTPTVTTRRSWTAFFALVLFTAVLAWMSRHVLSLLDGGRIHPVALFTLATFILFLALAWSERPYRATPAQRVELDKLIVTVNVPLYEEDPAIARQVRQMVLIERRGGVVGWRAATGARTPFDASHKVVAGCVGR